MQRFLTNISCKYVLVLVRVLANEVPQNVGRKEWNEIVPQLDLLFGTFRYLLVDHTQKEKTASGLLQLVLKTPQSLPVNTGLVVQQLCVFLTHSDNPTATYIDGRDRQIMVSKLFENLCTRATAKKTDIGYDPAENKTILELIKIVVERSQENDWESCDGLNPKLLQRIFRRCLRDGITAEEVGPVPVASLRLLQVLMKALSDPVHPMYRLRSMPLIPPPATVFEMLVSHSQFELTLSAAAKGIKGSSFWETGIELVRLMKCCVCLSVDLFVAKPVWNVILKTFNASLSGLDTETRQFFLLCRSKVSQAGSYGPFSSCTTEIVFTFFCLLVFFFV